MKTTLLSALAGTLVVGSVALAGCATDQDNSRLRAALDASSVSLQESVKIAEGSLSKSTATRATLLSKSKVLTVRALADNVSQELRIDPNSGEVLSANALSGNDEVCNNSVGLGAAIAAAEAAVGGQAVVIQPDDDGECNREVKVLDGADVLWEVKVAPNGEVIEQEVADDADETEG